MGSMMREFASGISTAFGDPGRSFRLEPVIWSWSRDGGDRGLQLADEGVRQRDVAGVRQALLPVGDSYPQESLDGLAHVRVRVFRADDLVGGQLDRVGPSGLRA